MLVVDLEAAVNDSAAGRALRDVEVAERRALQARFEEVRIALEAEEQEMARVRRDTPRRAFEERVVAFDQRVRAARRAAQEAGASLEARHAAGRRTLLAIAEPLLDALMVERDAAAVLDRAAVLRVDPDIDITQTLVEALNAAQPGVAGLLPDTPAPAPPPADDAADAPAQQ